MQLFVQQSKCTTCCTVPLCVDVPLQFVLMLWMPMGLINPTLATMHQYAATMYKCVPCPALHMCLSTWTRSTVQQTRLANRNGNSSVLTFRMYLHHCSSLLNAVSSIILSFWIQMPLFQTINSTACLKLNLMRPSAKLMSCWQRDGFSLAGPNTIIRSSL